MARIAKIAVDIDDTLYSFTDEAREALSVMVDEYPQYPQLSHALYANWDQWRTPFELCGEDEDGNSLWLECIARCHDSERILAQEPYNGAVEVLTELAEAGHELIYISNRATETEDATHQWLMANNFPYGELVVTSGDKAPFIRECQYMIDDRSKTVVEFIHDYEWQKKIRGNADNIRMFGPQIEDDPLHDEWERLDDNDTFGQSDVAERAAEAYLKANRRKAFVRVAGYNNGLTDVPGLYLAHTWRGLRRYMVKTGLLENNLVLA